MKIFAIIFTVILFLVPALQADADHLSYSPAAIILTISPEAESTTPVTVTLNEPVYSTYYLWFLDNIVSNDLPLGWITSSPSTTFISSSSSSATTNLTIRVPAGTLPGTYSGYLFSRAMASHTPADAGEGIFLEIIVPSGCNGLPTITITSFGPEVIWPPKHKMEDVTVSGNVTLPDGCSLANIGYVIDDEYGIYTGVGSIMLDNSGNFTVYIPVEGSRLGKDKDGRHYTISIFAEDEAGITQSQTLNTVVPHDQRNKKKQKLK